MPNSFPAPKKHEPKSFEHLIGRIAGLSEKQLRAHFGLYEGYVKKLNEIEEKLARIDRSSPNYSFNEYSELMRRHSVPFNGTYFHQLYFENLSGAGSGSGSGSSAGDRSARSGGGPQGELKSQIERDFGSLENWWADAKAALSSSHGWVLLTRSRIDGRLYNDMLEEHHRGVLCEQDIVLSLDGWEHAYMIDFGTTKADYLKVLEGAVDWAVASRRFDRACRAGSAISSMAA
jgi:Fe-Mn family superoxide dismutase